MKTEILSHNKTLRKDIALQRNNDALEMLSLLSVGVKDQQEIAVYRMGFYVAMATSMFDSNLADCILKRAIKRVCLP